MQELVSLAVHHRHLGGRRWGAFQARQTGVRIGLETEVDLSLATNSRMPSSSSSRRRPGRGQSMTDAP